MRVMGMDDWTAEELETKKNFENVVQNFDCKWNSLKKLRCTTKTWTCLLLFTCWKNQQQFCLLDDYARKMLIHVS